MQSHALGEARDPPLKRPPTDKAVDHVRGRKRAAGPSGSADVQTTRGQICGDQDLRIACPEFGQASGIWAALIGRARLALRESATNCIVGPAARGASSMDEGHVPASSVCDRTGGSRVTGGFSRPNHQEILVWVTLKNQVCDDLLEWWRVQDDQKQL